ncbi:lanthionine synthetase C family protein [Actinoallomurus soli]|uniref:lanthionine synthetase C family protein n=1 Tax=Actinoallomurus soli TaxID=2952535 RepID=UPI002093DE04|nr:lanthionine synthetase C family protein [Actinoallomurus soli]MCO5973356.1 lanthionine synthetase C family protein [Actinoallomurus soli]
MSSLTEVLSARQRHAAHQLAARLSDALAVPPPCGTHRGPADTHRPGQSLSKGAAGVAILHGCRARAGLGGWGRAHQWLAHAAGEDISAGPNAGLWHGAPAVAFAITVTAPPGRYPKAEQQLDAAVTALVQTRLQAAAARIAAAARPSRAEFDLVRGLTGLGAYLLHRDPHGPLSRQVLTYLVRLTEPLPADDEAGHAAPGWWTSDIPHGRPADVFRGGHADLGMAHGISGPLALLALAMRQGVTVDGQATAIHRICQWLDAWRYDTPTGPGWPQRVTLTDLRAGRSARTGPTRPSWCYGTPGIARAQQLAAQALGDRDRQRHAEQALTRCLCDPPQLARLTDAALCHGWAGLIATTWCAAGDALSADLGARLPGLLDTLLATVDASRVGQTPGLIDGNAGTALVLHTLATGTSGGWETSLLIN